MYAPCTGTYLHHRGAPSSAFFPTLLTLVCFAWCIHPGRALPTRGDGWGEFRRHPQQASTSVGAVLLTSVAKLPRVTLAIKNLNGGEFWIQALLRQYFAAWPSAGSRILHGPAHGPALMILTVPTDSTVRYCGFGLTRTAQPPATSQSLPQCISD